MIILVSDTSVLIDLERGGLLESAFSCGLTMVVPDLLYERELAADNGPLLRQLGLGVVALMPDEVAFSQQLRKQRPGLSLPDCFALSCARRPDHALVTGDRLLRMEAQSWRCAVYGLLWILDQMEASGNVAWRCFTKALHVSRIIRAAAFPRMMYWLGCIDGRRRVNR
jgi:predicted nucleic acid-binding protein